MLLCIRNSVTVLVPYAHTIIKRPEHMRINSFQIFPVAGQRPFAPRADNGAKLAVNSRIKVPFLKAELLLIAEGHFPFLVRFDQELVQP